MSRARMMPAVVTAAVGIVGVVGLAALATPPGLGDGLYLPDDGHEATVVMASGEVAQVEHAVLAATELKSGLAETVLAQEETLDAVALRLTFAPARPADQIIFTQDDQLSLQGFVLDGVGRVFAGGLPLEEGPGSGQIRLPDGADVDYSAQVTVTEGQDGCDAVEIVLETADDLETIATTLCRQAGPTSFEVQTASHGRLGFAPTTDPVPFADTTLQMVEPAWGAADRWTEHLMMPMAPDPFGDDVGARGLVGSPAVLLGGQIAYVDRRSDDVLVLAPDLDAQVATVAWRAHPGGQLVDVVAVGDMVVAVGTGGVLTGYSIDGVRLWRSDAATESVVGHVVPVTGRLTFATLDGAVWMLDAATGEVMWRHEVADHLTAGAVADERVTFAFDTEGNSVGFAATGEQAFSGSVPNPWEAHAIDEANVYMARSGVAEAYELQYSQFQWASDAVPAGVEQMCSTGSRLVIRANDGVAVLDTATGALVGTREDVQGIACGPDRVVASTSDGLEAWALSGAIVSLSLPEPAVGLDYQRTALAADGVWVIGTGYVYWWGA